MWGKIVHLITDSSRLLRWSFQVQKITSNGGSKDRARMAGAQSKWATTVKLFWPWLHTANRNQDSIVDALQVTNLQNLWFQSKSKTTRVPFFSLNSRQKTASYCSAQISSCKSISRLWRRNVFQLAKTAEFVPTASASAPNCGQETPVKSKKQQTGPSQS